MKQKKAPGKEQAVVYARYSSHNQGEQSIDGQLAAAKTYAGAKGYTIVHEYIDRAVSGRTDNREEFQKMLSDCAKKQFTVIIVWKVDRFGRNREEITFNKKKKKKHERRRGTGGRYPGVRAGGHGGVLQLAALTECLPWTP